MAKTIRQSFEDYKTNLEITNRQATLVSERHRRVVAAIKKQLSLNSEESKVTGSWDRNTLTRYLFEGDVDVMVILHYGNNKGWDNADGTIKALDRFKAILTDEYPDTTMRRDRNCISMQFSEFRLDVVPAFKYDDGTYAIPDAVRKQWVRTDPFAFADRISEVNKAMDGTFVPLIKMVKGWNRQVGWPIRSFHLECLMYERYRTYTEGYTYPSMLCSFFQALPSLLVGATFEPITLDRVDSYLDTNAQTTRRQIAIEEAQAAAAASDEAYRDQDDYPITAIGEWKNLLGDFFPAYG